MTAHWLNRAISLPQRILCETVKDFVAKVEKAQDKTLENTVVAEAVANKVRGHTKALEDVYWHNEFRAVFLKLAALCSCQNI